jgi:hypothetical protein
VSPPNLLAATIFVDGTKSVTGSEEGVPFLRMADSFQGAYDAGPNNVFVMYPRTLGPITGAGDPTYDESEADATTKIVAAVRAARKATPRARSTSSVTRRVLVQRQRRSMSWRAPASIPAMSNSCWLPIRAATTAAS